MQEEKKMEEQGDEVVMTPFPSTRLVAANETRRATIEDSLQTLRVRRDKLVNDMSNMLENLYDLVEQKQGGQLLVNRIKSRTLFEVQRAAHHCLETTDESKDLKEFNYLRCCIKIYQSVNEDLTALCGSAKPRNDRPLGETTSKRNRDDLETVAGEE